MLKFKRKTPVDNIPQVFFVFGMTGMPANYVEISTDEPFDKGWVCPYNDFMNLKKTLYILIGGLALLLGFIGIFLPVLPTTPFALVAAACFARSSPKLYQWLIRSKYFGEFIEHYETRAGVSKQTKVKAITFLWLALACSTFLISFSWIWGLLLLVGISVTIHISMIKTKLNQSNINNKPS